MSKCIITLFDTIAEKNGTMNGEREGERERGGRERECVCVYTYTSSSHITLYGHHILLIHYYQGADKSLARPTS